MSLTVHFVNANFELCSRCLQTAYFPTDHTGENIAMGLRECLANWGLKEEAQTCITTDNASNMVKAMELNQWTRLQCFGHRLHLAIGKYKNVCLCECVCLQSYYKCESSYYLRRGPSLCYITLPSNTVWEGRSAEKFVVKLSLADQLLAQCYFNITLLFILGRKINPFIGKL